MSSLTRAQPRRRSIIIANPASRWRTEKGSEIDPARRRNGPQSLRASTFCSADSMHTEHFKGQSWESQSGVRLAYRSSGCTLAGPLLLVSEAAYSSLSSAICLLLSDPVSFPWPHASKQLPRSNGLAVKVESSSGVHQHEIGKRQIAKMCHEHLRRREQSSQSGLLGFLVALSTVKRGDEPKSSSILRDDGFTQSRSMVCFPLRGQVLAR